MAVAIANDGTALTRADIYYNDNGTIKSINDMEVWVENNGTMFMFPQKDNCILNLDYTTFSINTLDGASTYLTNNFELWQDTSQKTILGDIIDTDPNRAGGFKVNNVDKYWWINNVGFTNLFFGSSMDIFANQAFTISMTVKFERNPGDWNDLWVFNDADQLRCEWNPQSTRLQIYGENNLMANDTFYPQADYIADFVHIDFVCDGTTIKGYQNGQQAFTSSITRNLRTGMQKVHICTNRGQSAPFGSGVYIKNMALWKAALTDQELNDYWNCIGII